jgi:diaminopimelate decarboxylase/aspartate kinase
MPPMPPAATASDWIVLKFGGTSVSRRDRWDTIGRLMAERAAGEGASVLAVVSALSGVTNELQALCAPGLEAAAFKARIEARV